MELDWDGQLEAGRAEFKDEAEFTEERVGGAAMFTSLDLGNCETALGDFGRGLLLERDGGFFTMFSFGRHGVLSEHILNVGGWLADPSSSVPQTEFGPNTASILCLTASSRILVGLGSCMQIAFLCEWGKFLWAIK